MRGQSRCSLEQLTMISASQFLRRHSFAVTILKQHKLPCQSLHRRTRTRDTYTQSYELKQTTASSQPIEIMRNQSKRALIWQKHEHGRNSSNYCKNTTSAKPQPITTDEQQWEKRHNRTIMTSIMHKTTQSLMAANKHVDNQCKTRACMLCCKEANLCAHVTCAQTM